MRQIHLNVAPEEYPEVQALGALWDDASKSWYIAAESPPARFARWLGEDTEEAKFNITSDEAFVAQGEIPCAECQKPIEVICIFCQSGVDAELDDPMEQVTVSDIWVMDEALAKQLTRWPSYKKAASQDHFANHCPHCGAMQEDYLLHSEPDHVFFRIAPERAGSIKFTPLKGRVQMSGDYSLEL